MASGPSTIEPPFWFSDFSENQKGGSIVLAAMNIQTIFDQFRQQTDDVAAAILTLASVLQGEQPELLTVRQAAERLNVSADCVYQMVEAGKLPHRRVGKGRGVIRIAVSDLAPKVYSLADLIR